MTEVDLEKTDRHFLKKILNQPGGELVTACFTCRTCVASCPITAVNDRFNPLRIIRMVLYGMKREVLENDFIWLCASCYACQERCPQGVSITDFMVLLKNMAIKEGFSPPGVTMQRDLVLGQGRIYPIDDFDNKKREKAGLPPLPTSCEIVNELFSKE